MITEDLVYELIIEGEEDEVYAISMVSEPAIESGWIAFDKEQVQFQAVDNDKRLVLGPILVPDKRILRIDGEGKPYHVFLSAPTIKKLSEKYLQNKYTDKVTVEHQKAVSDVSLVESWIVESRTKDKSAVYGLSLAPGTWAGTMKINNEKLWQDFVKTGKLTGFSIEGLFSHQLVEAANERYLLKEIDELTEDEAKKILNIIHSMLMDDVELAEPSVASSYPGNVHNKILQFAVPEITFTQFYDFLLDSNAGKPIWVKWNKVDGGQTTRSVYWGPFLNGIARGAIYDYEAYDYMVVKSEDNNDEWRTINLGFVTECRWEGKRYRVR